MNIQIHEALRRNCMRNLDRNGMKVKNCMKTSPLIGGMKNKRKPDDIICMTHLRMCGSIASLCHIEL